VCCEKCGAEVPDHPVIVEARKAPKYVPWEPNISPLDNEATLLSRVATLETKMADVLKRLAAIESKRK
jgi:hypothetical protein